LNENQACDVNNKKTNYFVSEELRSHYWTKTRLCIFCYI